MNTMETTLDLSVVVPAFNEEDSIEKCCGDLVLELEKEQGMSWEVLFVDDHSTDSTGTILKALSAKDRRIKYLRLSRNEGSHIAIAAGLNHSRGRCNVVMAADLQDPPDEIHKMLSYWREGYHVVWMVRSEEEEGYSPGLFGKLWYKVAQSLPGVSGMPPTGSDMFLLDRKVVRALRNQNLRKVAITILVRSLGFRQVNLLYTKRERSFGKSKWTMKRKFQHTMNTVMSFTNIPIRLVTFIGFASSAGAFLYSLFIIVLKLMGGGQAKGWPSMMFFSALSFGLMMLAIGIIGEYIWRIFENSRQTPSYIVEDSSVENSGEAHLDETL